jgi:hypothetical protein
MTVKNSFGKSFLLALAVFLALPAVALGQGNSRHGRNKDVFVNGHDARDGRLDKDDRRHRGRRGDTDEDFDEDDDNGRDRHRDRHRDHDRDDDRDDRRDDRRDRQDVARIAERNGFEDGLRAGRDDAARGERFDFRDEADFREATRGYRSEFGSLDFYRRNYREGFARGYERGYREARRDGGGFGDGSIRRAAQENGYRPGYNDGREDFERGDRYDFRDEGAYRDATAGYRSEYGDRELYRRYFRQAYERGYDDGYRGRSSRDGRRSGSRVGDVLGGVFGRP